MAASADVNVDMSAPLYTSDKTQAVRIRMGKEGLAAQAPKTIPEVFKATVAKHGDHPALVTSTGEQKTWAEYYAECRSAAKSFMKIGLNKFDAVNIIGFNSVEWFEADIGAILAGGIAAGIYTTNGEDACQYVSEHSEAVAVICDGPAQLQKFINIQPKLPKLKALIIYNSDVPEGASCGVPIYSWADFMALGAEIEDAALDERMDACKPGEVSTLIYTSGTTGPPKAVMISHDNVTWTASAVQEDIGLSEKDRMVSYLPLSHIAAQMLDLHAPMAFGYTIYFARPDALKGTIVQTLKAARPTIFFGVPRVWEKIQEKLMAVGRANSGCKLAIATWAKELGLAYSKTMQTGVKDDMPLFWGLANAIVFEKVKNQIGLDKMRMAYSAAAPISKETINYFCQLNIQIMEIYGMSECTGPCTINYDGTWKIGSVGVAMGGTDIKLAEGSDEITWTGRHIFMGYMKMPEKTADTIDDEGYLHSGDVGAFDEDKFLSITGRIKDLIITAGGENIPPVIIENAIKAAIPAVSNAVVYGDKQKFLTALLTLKTTPEPETGGATRELASDAKYAGEDIGSDATTTDAAIECEKWTEFINKGMEEANSKATSRAQRIAKFKIIPDDHTVANGMLTATMKLKRNIVYKKYMDEIMSMYGDDWKN